MTPEFRHGAPRCPQTQGAVERVNQTLKRCLKAMMRQPGVSLRDAIKKVVAYYNSKTHRTTQETPNYVFSLRGHERSVESTEEVGRIFEVIQKEQASMVRVHSNYCSLMNNVLTKKINKHKETTLRPKYGYARGDSGRRRGCRFQR